MNEAAALVGLPLPAEERRTLRRNAAGLAFALLGGAVATAVLGAVLVAPMMALLIALILVVCACAVLLRRDVSLVSPLSLAIVTFVLSYCVRPLYLSLRGDVESIADRVNPELFMPALGLVLAFVLSFVSGHLAPWGVRLARFFPVPKTTWARGRVLIVQALLGALSVVLYLVLLRLSGMSLGAAFLQPTDFRAVTSAEGLFYISGLLLWSMWAIFFLELTWRAPDGVTALGLLTLGALAGVLVVFTLPFGARGFVLGPLIGILWVLDMAVLKRRLSLAVVTPICFVVAVFVGGYGVYRDFNAGFSNDRYLDEAISNAFGIDLLDRFAARFDNFDFLVWTIDEFPTKRQGYLWGRSATDFLLQPIPRSVMPGKPSQTSAFLMDVLKPTYDRTITPEFGLISEMYINAWIPGVMLGAFAWGLVMRALDEYLTAQRHNASVVFWYSSIALLPMGWLLAGLNSFGSVLFITNTIFAGVVLLAVRQPGSSRA